MMLGLLYNAKHERELAVRHLENRVGFGGVREA
jgi:hypothetical protein